jgi:hypothetical protein
MYNRLFFTTPMEALQAIKYLAAELQYSLSGENVDPNTLLHMSSYIQACAKNLKKLEDARIKDLEENGPKLVKNGNQWSLTLLRNKEKYLCFDDCEISLDYCWEQETRNFWNITESPDPDGFTYFIVATPRNTTYAPSAVYLTKKEFYMLEKKIL